MIVGASLTYAAPGVKSRWVFECGWPLLRDNSRSFNGIGYNFWFRLCQYMVGLVGTSILGSSVIDIFCMTTPLLTSIVVLLFINHAVKIVSRGVILNTFPAVDRF